MSQEKVNRYKAEKAHRKETLRRQKQMDVVRKTVVSVVCVAVLGWVGFSAYGVYMDNQPRKAVQVNYDAVTEYLKGI